MADSLYFLKGLDRLNIGGDYLTADLRWRLLTPSAVPDTDTWEFASDLTNELGVSGYAEVALSGPAITPDLANDLYGYFADDVDFGTLGAGLAEWLVLYRHVTNDADSPLILALNLGDGGIDTTGSFVVPLPNVFGFAVTTTAVANGSNEGSSNVLFLANADELDADFESKDLRWAALTPTATPSGDTWQFVDDLANELLVGYSRQNISGATRTVDTVAERITYSADDVTFDGLSGGSYIGWLVLFRHVTNDADSLLICALKVGPYPTDSGTIVIPIPASTGFAWSIWESTA